MRAHVDFQTSMRGRLTVSRLSFSLLTSIALLPSPSGVKGQGYSAASPAASGGAVQSRCENDPAAEGGGEESVPGTHGHSRGDGSLRLRGAQAASAITGDSPALLHAETR